MEVRVYKHGRRWKVLGLSVCAVMILGSVAMILSPLFGQTDAPVALVIVGVGSLAMWVALYRGLLAYRIILNPDLIEVNNGLPYGRRRMKRADIASKSRDVEGYLFLYPRDKSLRPLAVDDSVQRDGYFKAWMDSIPDS